MDGSGKVGAKIPLAKPVGDASEASRGEQPKPTTMTREERRRMIGNGFGFLVPDDPDGRKESFAASAFLIGQLESGALQRRQDAGAAAVAELRGPQPEPMQYWTGVMAEAKILRDEAREGMAKGVPDGKEARKWVDDRAREFVNFARSAPAEVAAACWDSLLQAIGAAVQADDGDAVAILVASLPNERLADLKNILGYALGRRVSEARKEVVWQGAQRENALAGAARALSASGDKARIKQAASVAEWVVRKAGERDKALENNPLAVPGLARTCQDLLQSLLASKKQ